MGLSRTVWSQIKFVTHTHDAQTDRTLPIETHSESAKNLAFCIISDLTVVECMCLDKYGRHGILSFSLPLPIIPDVLFFPYFR